MTDGEILTGGPMSARDLAPTVWSFGAYRP
ncbi:hypothetical protein GA0070612_3088 [Micromonospora chokoriensis]|uniref:Uncharacterized protein n=1 Tax=Micromonospora chokoriensis TaxID=356851 RepID=A0A1C4X0H8_9ACTN|nr:hypothetical protein GA0070612_3088 [Micromonospora chokoriensis]